MLDNIQTAVARVFGALDEVVPRPILLSLLAFSPLILLGLLYLGLYLVAPVPRPSRKSELSFIAISQDGTTTEAEPLPCWHDTFLAQQRLVKKKKISREDAFRIEDADVFVSLVIPAYNEEDRLSSMLEEAVQVLQDTYPQAQASAAATGKSKGANGTTSHPGRTYHGWEILLVSDGSTDKTVDVALSFARAHQITAHPPTPAGPRTDAQYSSPKTRSKSAPKTATSPYCIPAGSMRVIQLEENRGKGGAVTHGMRHARGAYIVFADADGASRFSDLAPLVEGAQRVQDAKGRAVGIGSRAHLVGSEAVVKRSFIRNTLMHSFHLLLRLMTPPATAAIKDTQCGFKLFTRAALPYIIPFMHSEGWIFDVEMLMLAESAGIPMVEVAVGWKEVTGSKLNVVWDSLGMAWGLAVLRAAWMMGIYEPPVADDVAKRVPHGKGDFGFL